MIIGFNSEIVFGAIPAPMQAWADAALRALLAAGFVAAILRAFRVRNVVVQKAAWTAVLIGAVTMPLVAPWAAGWNWIPKGASIPLPKAFGFVAPTSGAAATGPVFASSQVSSPASSAWELPATSYDTADTGTAHFPTPNISYVSGLGSFPAAVSIPIGNHSSWNVFACLWGIYLLVSVALLTRLFYGLAVAIRLWMQAEPINAALLPTPAEGLRLRWNPSLPSPVTIGSGVVLPADYATWDVEKLRIVLAHESSHVRQGDFYLQFCAALYAAVFWISPLGWWLKRKLGDLSEAISDHAGLAEAADRVSYAQVLLEFAALPRPAEAGVAMAHSGRLTHRIERLLNEVSFSQAFAGGRRRAVVAGLATPVLLFACAAIVRVHAATQEPQPIPAPPTVAAPAPAPAPMPAPAPQVVPAAPAAPAAPHVVPEAPEPPEPPMLSDDGDQEVSFGQTLTINGPHGKTFVERPGHGFGFAFGTGGQTPDGDSYALVTGPGQNFSFSGNGKDCVQSEINKARKLGHQQFLWFMHDGKSYIVDDPALVANLAAMYKPMEELGRQQAALGMQQKVLGAEQAALAKSMNQITIPKPDLQKEMAQLDATLSKMKGDLLNPEQLNQINAKIAAMQEKLSSLDSDFGARQGQLGEMQGKLGEKQGKLGEMQGRLGAEQGRIAQENNRKIKSIIDDSLRSGKAKPIQ